MGSRPYNILLWAVSPGWRSALISIDWRPSSAAAHAMALASKTARTLFRRQLDAKDPLPQFRELISRARGLLELEVARVLQHLLLERLDLARKLLLRHGLEARLLAFFLGLRGVVDAVDQVLDALHHADRRDAVQLVVADL